MSSTAATGTATATVTALSQTYWCHECDMSVSLIISSSSSSTVPLQVICPYSNSHLLEPMDCSHSQTHFQDFNFFLDYNFDDDNDDDLNSLLPSWMTTIQISDSASQESCAICKDEFDSEAQQLPCKHFYHTHCIIPWLSLHSSCPLCRFQLPGERDVELADSSDLF